MHRQPVSSRSLASIGYEAESQTLEAEFQNTGLYRYFNVPEPLYRQLMAAPSLGGFFNANIKGHFPYLRVTGQR